MVARIQVGGVHRGVQLLRSILKALAVEGSSDLQASTRSWIDNGARVIIDQPRLLVHQHRSPPCCFVTTFVAASEAVGGRHYVGKCVELLATPSTVLLKKLQALLIGDGLIVRVARHTVEEDVSFDSGARAQGIDIEVSRVGDECHAARGIVGRVYHV